MNAPRPLLSYYGDDFTGSTDVMEALAGHGVDTLLFLRMPSSEEIERCRLSQPAIGIAGISRSKGVAWMDRELPLIYARLKQVGASICHYKVCSTFDSAPEIGNIGRAMEIGRSALGAGSATPIVAGAPMLRRYTAFGHLFAAVGDDYYRIDRHPTMSVHPITPMNEADLRVHLGKQTALRVGLFDHVTQAKPDARDRLDAAMSTCDALLFDVFDQASQLRVGKLIWDIAAATDERPLFCVGSSGLEHALVAHWRSLGVSDVRPATKSAEGVDKIIVVSGSCSPVTGAQIDHAETDGFRCVRADPIRLLEPASRQAEIARLEAAALAALRAGESIILFTARGPGDPEIERVRRFVDDRGASHSDALATVGETLGALLRELMSSTGVRRVAVAGGDTSGQVTSALGLAALTMKANVAPGAPLCAGIKEIGERPTVEIALKGGQMGTKRFFSAVRAGRALD